jgi:hypothetical protein
VYREINRFSLGGHAAGSGAAAHEYFAGKNSTGLNDTGIFVPGGAGFSLRH